MSKGWKTVKKELDALDNDCAYRFAKAIDGIWTSVSDSLGLFSAEEKTLIGEALQEVGTKMMTKMIFNMGDWEALSGDFTKIIADSTFASRVKQHLDSLRRTV